MLLAGPGTGRASGGQDFTVAIDPGHGGSNLGAASPDGVREKTLALELARRIEKRLLARKKVGVVLCRREDVYQTVRARVRCANRAKARLFISLHANASPAGPKQGTKRGFELYLLPAEDVAVDAEAASLLAETPAEAAFASHRARQTATESLAAARRIAWRLADLYGLDRNRGIKQEGALVDVLQGLLMPGVLIEVGFIDHPEEGKFITSEKGQEALAEAIARGIEDVAARERRGRADPATTGRRSRGQVAADEDGESQ